MSDPLHCPGIRDAALITIDTLVPLKHDRCAVAADFFAQDGIGNQTAGIRIVPCRNEPLCPKAELRDGNDPRGEDGNGFIVPEHTKEALIAAVRRALDMYKDKPAWTALMRRAMTEDWSWSASAKKYVQLYNDIIGK